MKLSKIISIVFALSLFTALEASARISFTVVNNAENSIRVCAFDANDGLTSAENTSIVLAPAQVGKLFCKGQGKGRCQVRLVPDHKDYNCGKWAWPTRKIKKDGMIIVKRWSGDFTKPKSIDLTIRD